MNASCDSRYSTMSSERRLRPILARLAVVLFVATGTNAADIKPAEDISLITDDGVLLHAVYYSGSQGKQTVPVILLHGWDGPRGAGRARDFDDLATDLQSAGHAVVVPDLRGHGDSRTVQRASGAKVAISRKKLGARGLKAMVSQDVEAVKRFLIREHNRGSVNIELLCVVGSEMGAAVASTWAAQDWAWPNVRDIKQGQDVRALILISPPASFGALSVAKPLSFGPLQRVPKMILYGNQSDASDEAVKRITRLLDTRRPGKQQLLVKVAQQTSLRGTALLNPQLDTIQRIREFIQQRVVDQRDRFPWRARVIGQEQS